MFGNDENVREITFPVIVQGFSEQLVEMNHSTEFYKKKINYITTQVESIHFGSKLSEGRSKIN